MAFPVHTENINKIMAVDPADSGPWMLIPGSYNCQVPCWVECCDLMTINIDGMLCNGTCI